MKTQIEPFGALPNLPRIGYQLVLPGSFENFTWYGRGPHENYTDQNTSALIGLYENTVDKLFTHYIVPQENGNKTDVRWAKLANSKNRGMRISGDIPLETSVLHYSTMALTEAVHSYDLKKEDRTYWNIDYKQGGLGGNSCGPPPLKRYLLRPEPVSFSLFFEPVMNK